MSNKSPSNKRGKHYLAIYLRTGHCVNLDLCWGLSLEIPAVMNMQIAMAQQTLKNWWVEKLKANAGLDGEII